MFAVAVHEPVQSALHFVVQSAVVETGVHCVVQWSSQQALHEASQSVDDDDDTDPSDEVDDEELDVQDELQLAWQRELQSVVQSKVGGLFEQVDEHEDWQLDTHIASADVVHCPSHCCSSCAAHASSQLAGAHCVAQSFWSTRLHCALASTWMFPQAATPALAGCGHARSARHGSARVARRAQRFVGVFMSGVFAIHEPCGAHLVGGPGATLTVAQ